MGSQIEGHTLENRSPAAHNGAGLNGDMHLKHLAWALCALVLLVSLAFGASTTTTPGRKMYKWVDEQGVTHYGDHIPPEYATQEQHVINAQGIEVQRLEAQKTPEQLAAEDEKKLEAEKSAARDKNLLNTYVSVQEIEHLRDQRLTLLTDQIKVTNQFLEILDGKLKKLRLSSMYFKPYSADPKAPPMSDQIAEDLVRVGTDIRTQEENLRQKRSEEAIMSQQFESDIERFKELKGIH
jgi:Domain of unknown function (DUF4124)